MNITRNLALTAAIAAVGLGSQAFAAEYIIIGNDAGLPGGLESAVANAGGVLTGTLPQINIAFAQSDDAAFAEQLGGIQAVTPDLLFSTPAAPMTMEVDAVSVTSGGTANGIGDDEGFFPLLWGMDAINAPEAWEAGNTGAGATVFVLDEGFDMDHPDIVLDGNLAESFACYDIVAGAVISNPANCEPVDYTLPDTFSHGTHTAGTIGAEDNGMGVIGVAPDADMVPVKVLSENLGFGFSSWIMAGIIYAADNGADVINMSLGGSASQGAGPNAAAIAAWRVAYNRAVQYANSSGATVVVSAGNDAMDVNNYPSLKINPAMTSHAVTVSATGPRGIFYDPATNLDEQASYTNTGSGYVDVAAPGGDFTVWPNFGWWYDMVLSTGNGGWYWSAGTSMAAPHVSGIAALIVSENGGDANPAQVKRELKQRAEDLGKRGVDSVYGHGRVTTGY